MSALYTDPTTGQWVAEHETRNPETGEVSRETEWFDVKADALHFQRHGSALAVTRYTGHGLNHGTYRADLRR